MKKNCLRLSALSLLLAVGAHAQEMPVPTVGYSAVRTIQAGGVSMDTTVYYEDSKERSEMSMGGQSIVTIMRHDRGVLWMLMPGGMYMEQPLDGSGAPMGPGQQAAPPTINEQSTVLEFEAEGSESVNGLATTRYRMRAENPDGSAVAGQIWLTDENIPVQMRFDVESGGQGGQIQMSLRDVNIGDQPDELFEIPEGSQKFSLPNFGGAGFPGAADPPPDEPGLTEEIADAAREGAEDAAVEETRRGVRDAVSRGIRGIFNRD